MQISPPYLLFIGDVVDRLAAKTSDGIARWRPEWCLGQFRSEGCPVDLGFPDYSLEKARSLDAKTLVLGVANRGGIMAPHWIDTIKEALRLGYDIASGLHDRLNNYPELVKLASSLDRQLLDVRYATIKTSVGTGKKRSGQRLLTVGTDCSVGKMFTTLALQKEMQLRSLSCDFVATGQTGIFISGKGASIDAIVADFISGAVEALSPDHPDPRHWDFIEGQGSLFHPSYAGVSLGLLHGAQADRLIMCHDLNRPHLRGLPHYSLPEMGECIRRNEGAGRLTNPVCRTLRPFPKAFFVARSGGAELPSPPFLARRGCQPRLSGKLVNRKGAFGNRVLPKINRRTFPSGEIGSLPTSPTTHSQSSRPPEAREPSQLP